MERWKNPEVWITLAAKLLSALVIAGVIAANHEAAWQNAVTNAVVGVFAILAFSSMVHRRVTGGEDPPQTGGGTTAVLLLLSIGVTSCMAADLKQEPPPQQLPQTPVLSITVTPSCLGGGCNCNRDLQGLAQQVAGLRQQQQATTDELKKLQVVQQRPIQVVPIQQQPIQQLPIQGQPIQVVPIQGQPIQMLPIQQQPIQVVPIQQLPIQQFPIQGIPVTPQPIQVVPVQPVTPQQPQQPIQQIPVNPNPQRIGEVPPPQGLQNFSQGQVIHSTYPVRKDK